MKPGNRQSYGLKWCQFTQSDITLRDEREDIRISFRVQRLFILVLVERHFLMYNK